MEKNYVATERGIPQGSSNSPVLMNIYLHYFDPKMMGFHFMSAPHLRYTRYADDLLCRDMGEPHLARGVLSTIYRFMRDPEFELKTGIYGRGSYY